MHPQSARPVLARHSSARRTAARLAALLPALLATPVGTAAAQSLVERLEIHGSLNAAYGRADSLPVFGVPTRGTSDYRVFTLQGRYTLGAKDQIVAQVFNRRLGASPMASAISDVTMQWAYWQHREGDLSVKLGRNPLPRGLLNEVRYIGTVLPFFRPPMELQSDAFDAIDGAVVSYRQDLGRGFELEQHAFGGGSEWRAIASTSTGQQIRIARTENMFGGQTYFSAPFAGLRVGAYGARYGFVQSASRGFRTNVILSAEATPVERLKLQTEHGRITGHGPANDNRSGYVQATLRLTDLFSVAGQRAYTNRRLYFANPALDRIIPEVRTTGASGIVRLPSNSVLKVEHHWRSGWAYDVATPPVAAQSANAVTLAPKQRGRYFLVSVASSF